MSEPAVIEPNLKFINLTGRDVNILDKNEYLYPAGTERITVSTVVRGEAYTQSKTIPTLASVDMLGVDQDSLPEEKPDTFYIVTYDVAYLAGRRDFVYPLDEVLDAEGNVIGHKKFAVVLF